MSDQILNKEDKMADEVKVRNEMLDAIRGSLEQRAEGREAGGDIVVMELVDRIVARESLEREQALLIKAQATDFLLEAISDNLVALNAKLELQRFCINENNAKIESLEAKLRELQKEKDDSK